MAISMGVPIEATVLSLSSMVSMQVVFPLVKVVQLSRLKWPGSNTRHILKIHKNYTFTYVVIMWIYLLTSIDIY